MKPNCPLKKLLIALMAIIAFAVPAAAQTQKPAAPAAQVQSLCEVLQGDALYRTEIGVPIDCVVLLNDGTVAAITILNAESQYAEMERAVRAAPILSAELATDLNVSPDAVIPALLIETVEGDAWQKALFAVARDLGVSIVCWDARGIVLTCGGAGWQ